MPRTHTGTSDTPAAAGDAEFGEAYAAEQIRRSRHPLRAFVKGFYLREMLRDLEGPTIDFGCGAGQLLRRLPAGSAGVEVNRHLVKLLRDAGLTVHAADGAMSDFELAPFDGGGFRSLAIAHVLEHVPDPASALRTLLAACRRIGVRRVVVVVPGAKGFASDATHKVFIDRDWVQRHVAGGLEGFRCAAPKYFPGNFAAFGRFFIYHEMKLVFSAA